jgi:hypothetical protein
MEPLDDAVDHVRGGSARRMCQCCGRIGCCDSSPHRHASAHARDGGHPIARSAEPGENWSWCYVDDVAFAVTGP